MMKEAAMYLGWFDDNGKKPTTEKIREAMAAYRARFHADPNVVLVSRDEEAPAEVDGVLVRAEGYIRRNNFWAGFEGVAAAPVQG